RFAVRRVLPVVTTELLELQLLRHRLPVFRRRVVATFALGALQRDDFASCARHDVTPKLTVESVEPSTRFELVTPSLPRTCSTPELRGRNRARITAHLLRCRSSRPLNVDLTTPRGRSSLRLASAPFFERSFSTSGAG